MRLFFATDLHGSQTCFGKFLNAASAYKADVLIMGGDVRGKTVVPILARDDGTFSCEFGGRLKMLPTDDDVRKQERLIEGAGAYPYRTNPQEFSKIQNDQSELKKLFLRLASERLERWDSMAKSKLSGSGVDLYFTGGNDDWPELLSSLENMETLKYAEGRTVDIGEVYPMISTGYSSITPWKCPRDIAEEDLAKRIEDMASQVPDIQNSIFNFHVPPKGSGLDNCAELDTREWPPKPITVGATPKLYPAGSSAVRDAIERWQPLLGLHGHIHECKGFQKIGRTLCINPGSEYSQGVLWGTIVNLRKRKVESYMITSG